MITDRKLVFLNLLNTVLDEAPTLPVQQFNRNMIRESQNHLVHGGKKNDYTNRFGMRTRHKIDFQGDKIYKGAKYKRNLDILESESGCPIREYAESYADNIILFEGKFPNDFNMRTFKNNMPNVFRKYINDLVEDVRRQENVIPGFGLDLFFTYSKKSDFYTIPYQDIIDVLKGNVEFYTEQDVNINLILFNMDDVEEKYDINIHY